MRADELLEMVKSGDDFAELAKSESTCPSAAQGGDLGEPKRGQMVAPFENAAFGLEPGDASGSTRVRRCLGKRRLRGLW
jgi:peptidyl-prolyl cis-trans isomerase C